MLFIVSRHSVVSPTGEVVREGLCGLWGFEGLVGRQWMAEEVCPPLWWRAAWREGAWPRGRVPDRGQRCPGKPWGPEGWQQAHPSSPSAPAQARPSSRTWTPPMPPAPLALLPPASRTTPGELPSTAGTPTRTCDEGLTLGSSCGRRGLLPSSPAAACVTPLAGQFQIRVLSFSGSGQHVPGFCDVCASACKVPSHGSWLSELSAGGLS